MAAVSAAAAVGDLPGGRALELLIPAVANAPKILAAACERLRKLLTHPLRFTELHGSEMLRPSERRRVEPRRGERREAIFLVGSALLHYADVLTLRVGSPRGDGLVTPPGHDKLAEITGLSLTRLRRAIHDGRAAGYWDSTQPVLRYKNAIGDWAYASFRVVYRLTEKFFKRLGLGPKLARERVKAAERARDRTRIHPLALLQARELVRASKAGSREFQGPQASADAAENEARRMSELRAVLRHRWPDWPADRVEAQARRLYRQT